MSTLVVLLAFPVAFQRPPVTRFSLQEERGIDGTVAWCMIRRQFRRHWRQLPFAEGGPHNYDVLTAYIGRPAPREVGDRSLRWASPEDRAESEHFWSNHALIAELQQF